MTGALLPRDCINLLHLRQMPDGGIAPQPWMQMRHVASAHAPSRAGDYAPSGGGDKNDLLQTLTVYWTNDSPLQQSVYGLVTRGGCRVTLQATSRAYLLQKQCWSAGPGPREWVDVVREMLSQFLGPMATQFLLELGMGSTDPSRSKIRNWIVDALEKMLIRWTDITNTVEGWITKTTQGWANDLLALIDEHHPPDDPIPKWIAWCQKVLRGFAVQTNTVKTGPQADDWIEISRTGTGLNVGLGGMLALGTSFGVTEIRENSSTIPLMPNVTGWPIVEPGEEFWAGVQLWFFSEFWQGAIIDGGSEGAESSYDTGETRLDLFAVPIIGPTEPPELEDEPTDPGWLDPSVNGAG